MRLWVDSWRFYGDIREEWRDAKKDLERTGLRLKVITVTLAKCQAEITEAENLQPGQNVVQTPFVASDPKIQPLRVLPTQQEIDTALKDFKSAQTAEDDRFKALSPEDRVYIRRQ